MLGLHLGVEPLGDARVDLEQAAPGGELVWGERGGGGVGGGDVGCRVFGFRVFGEGRPAPGRAPAGNRWNYADCLTAEMSSASLTLSATSMLPLPSAWLNFIP